MMSPGARQLFISSMANRRQLLTTGLSLLSGALRSGYASAVGSPVYQRFEAIEDQIAASTGSGPVSVNPKSWQAVSGQYVPVMLGIQTANAGRFQARSADSSSTLLAQAVLAGGAGLLAGLTLKIRDEERVLSARFGARWDAYRRRVPRLVPRTAWRGR